MRIVEVRELEGPNLFLLEPAFKVELEADETERQEAADRLSTLHGADEGHDLAEHWRLAVEALHRLAGREPVATAATELDEPNHLALAFGWSHRPVARAVSDLLAQALTSSPPPRETCQQTLREAAALDPDPPELARPGDTSALAIAVTGTNGKTTTTRLLSHIFREAGRRVGWSSTSGIYVDGQLVEAGDYSGPSGARHVLRTPGLDVAILETARGGILLRGLGYESNDISVFTNISADHLGLHGVLTLERMAQVKAVVCRVTRPEGWCVLNADDHLVMGATQDVRARRCLVSRNAQNERVKAHLSSGGAAVLADEAAISVCQGDRTLWSVLMAEVPVTVDGRAAHQVENVSCAIGAAWAAGLPFEAIGRGLATFRNDLAHNPGRLNVLEAGGVTVVLDYAHNEEGLRRLLTFGRELQPEGRLITVIGTAGDRADESLMALGRIAAEGSDYVIAKGTERYLRGRDHGALLDLYRQGAACHPETPFETAYDERAGLERALEICCPGDVVLLMFQELLGEVEERVRALQPQTS